MTIDEIKTKLSEVINEPLQNDRAAPARSLLVSIIDHIYESRGCIKPKNATLLQLIDSPTVTGYINDPDILNAMHYVRIIGMNAEHGKNIRRKEAKLAVDNVSYLVGLVESKDNGTYEDYQKLPYMSEANTRKLYIDIYLREAGWEVLDNENVVQPGKAGVEIEVHGMPNGHGIGYCDYVLYGKDGRPLAIIEVKKTTVSPEIGRHQVNLYAECMEKIYGYKPILYYTNGYITKIIDGIYPDRTVMSFHSIDELELMLQKRNRKKITDFSVDESIAGRPYQKMAITNLCEWFNKNHRRGLLVMATGTGKTRVAIALVDVLARNKWVKNVLFLADRTTLVSQAKRAFTDLMPNMSVCELSGEGEKDYNARLMFCTYQTMINYIDAEDKRFTTGRFDLIIIDEAHRSIFNKYGTIFRYFDSLLVGLTATPKNEVDANTYRIFNCEAGIPNFDYSLEDGVKDRYLVGYRVINRTSQMISEGIKYDELSEEEKEQLDDYLEEDPPTPDFNIPGNKLFKYLFNKDTCRKVLEELMTYGIRVDAGETLGKSIIFAYNHKHAQMIVDCFHELYPEYDANTCQLVDYSVNYSKDLVLKFEGDPVFRIAVSVDMLDTGVDVPAVLNLVFFKKVRSKIKFIQMIGRGTRLCKDIYGPGKDKNGFLIFDYCGNFEYFNVHVDGKEGKMTVTLSQRRFDVRLDMLNELQRLEYQEDPWLHAYYEQIKADLHNTVVTIKSHNNRIQVREEEKYVDKYHNKDVWTSLSPVNIKEIKTHLLPLVDSGLGGNHLSVAFDVRMYVVEHALLKSGNIKEAVDSVKNIRKVAQYLLTEKASVPQVLEKASDLKVLMGTEFWSDPTVQGLEKFRNSVRDVMKFLEGRERKQYDIDIEDIIDNSSFIVEDTTIDIRTYRQRVIDYLVENSDKDVIRKIHNLEPINNDDLNELEKILWCDLGTQEEYQNTTNIINIAAFVRSLIGLNQEAVNEKFGEYIHGNTLNYQQQEFLKTIINYARENGDIELTDIVNTEPFSNYDINDLFGVNVPTIVKVVGVLHNTICIT